ncbi:MAG: 50S ribosomal protein L23 [Candidatus Peregrinibacteria bacterium]|nr:50S ribosomal protein L23 [Candidatus Peregrinibacteria bacterium]
MNIMNVIIGPVTTEKSERLRMSTGKKTYTLQVAPAATKIEVRNALEKLYDVHVAGVRMITVRPKSRTFGSGQSMEKRHASKRALVTLTEKSKALDLAAIHLS